MGINCRIILGGESRQELILVDIPCVGEKLILGVRNEQYRVSHTRRLANARMGIDPDVLIFTRKVKASGGNLTNAN